MIRTLLAAVAVSLGLSLLASCQAGKNDPGRVYAPDMYFSQAYDAYVPSTFTNDGLSARTPAPNTVPYGTSAYGAPTLEPWPFPNLSDADTAQMMPSMRSYLNPVPVSETGLASGQKNYNIYCAICHGGNGQGKGYLVTGTSYSQAPANLMDARFLSKGTSDAWFYHVMQFGKNSMGSYAYALSREQRWEIIHYIRSMQVDYVAEKAAADAAAAAEAAANPPVPADTLVAAGATAVPAP
jgi:mono/diheme cytochrome c family protein